MVNTDTSTAMPAINETDPLRGEARREVAQHPRLADPLVGRALMLAQFTDIINELINHHH